jgi:hypothetical protein
VGVDNAGETPAVGTLLACFFFVIALDNRGGESVHVDGRTQPAFSCVRPQAEASTNDQEQNL